MNDPVRIGVDLDGVLYNFENSFKAYLETIGIRNLPTPNTWSVWEHWGMTQDEWMEHFAEGVDAGIIFRVGEPEVNAIDVLNQFKQDGYVIHIVTHRFVGKKSIHNTYDWLDEHEVPYDTLTFAKDKTVVPTDYFIEDNADNYLALEAAGTKTVLMDRPWNRHIDAYRITNWKEFYDAVRVQEGR